MLYTLLTHYLRWLDQFPVKMAETMFVVSVVSVFLLLPYLVFGHFLVTLTAWFTQMAVFYFLHRFIYHERLINPFQIADDHVRHHRTAYDKWDEPYQHNEFKRTMVHHLVLLVPLLTLLVGLTYLPLGLVIGMMGIVSDHCFMHRLAHDKSMRHNVIGKLYYSNHMQHHAHPNHLQYGGTFAIMDVLGRTFPTKKRKRDSGLVV